MEFEEEALRAIAKEAIELTAPKLPIKTKFVIRRDFAA